jgi:hypothetical protein
MGTILFNNNNNTGHSQEQKNAGESKPGLQDPQNPTPNQQGTEMEDEFAIFPEWSVVPPNSIINPRIKRKI